MKASFKTRPFDSIPDRDREELAGDAFGKPFANLSDTERQAVLDILSAESQTYMPQLEMAAEFANMSSNSKKVFRDAVAEIREKRRHLRATFAKRYQEYLVTEKSLLKEIGDHDQDPDADSTLSMHLEVYGKPYHEAARWVLERAGEPVRLADIVDCLMRAEYNPSITRKTLENSLYVSMKRKKDEFFVMDNGEWGLTEFDSGPEE